jgi:hypothetical protein
MRRSQDGFRLFALEAAKSFWPFSAKGLWRGHTAMVPSRLSGQSHKCQRALGQMGQWPSASRVGRTCVSRCIVSLSLASGWTSARLGSVGRDSEGPEASLGASRARTSRAGAAPSPAGLSYLAHPANSKFDIRTSVCRTTASRTTQDNRTEQDQCQTSAAKAVSKVSTTSAEPKAAQTCTDRVTSDRPSISTANLASQLALPETKSGGMMLEATASCSHAGLCFCLLSISAVDRTSSTIFFCMFLRLLLFGCPLFARFLIPSQVKPVTVKRQRKRGRLKPDTTVAYDST